MIPKAITGRDTHYRLWHQQILTQACAGLLLQTAIIDRRVKQCLRCPQAAHTERARTNAVISKGITPARNRKHRRPSRSDSSIGSPGCQEITPRTERFKANFSRNRARPLGIMIVQQKHHALFKGRTGGPPCVLWIVSEPQPSRWNCCCGCTVSPITALPRIHTRSAPPNKPRPLLQAKAWILETKGIAVRRPHQQNGFCVISNPRPARQQAEALLTVPPSS